MALAGGIVSTACSGRTNPPALLETIAETRPIDTLLLRDISRQLSADVLQGRKTASVGGAQAATAIAWFCYSLGLRAISSNEYYQYVPLIESEIDSIETLVRITGPGFDTTFQHNEFIVDAARRETLHDFYGDLVYVGRAADLLVRRSDLPPLEGKVALLRGEIGANPEAADTLMARGAVGILQVVDDARRFRLYRATRGASRYYIDDAAVPTWSAPLIPTLLAGPRTTVVLYRGLTGASPGSWNDAYLNGLAAGLPAPQPLAGWRAAVSIGVRDRSVWAPNVACRLDGSGSAADSALMLVAHYDHLGIGAPDLAGDSIYNGFSDNSVGVAMALAIGGWFAREREEGRGLRHSLLLVFPTGEEQGLLGSEYFLSHSPWPLSHMLAALNLDANVPAGRPRSWRVAGDDTSRLVRSIRAEAERHGWATTVAPATPASDYYAFIQRGVPATFVTPGGGSYEGRRVSTSDSLRALLQARYHQPSDEYSSDFPFEGVLRYAEFMRDVLRRLDGPRGEGHFARRDEWLERGGQ